MNKVVDIDFSEVLEAARRAEAERARTMPDEAAALHVMFVAYQRLMELGFKQAIYCPKDGTVFEAVEPGSTGIHPCHYEGEWPDGGWWVHEANDLWPSRPCLFREMDTSGERDDG